MQGPLVEVRQPGARPLYVVVHDALELGRDCDGLILTDTEVSRRHLELRDDGGTVTVSDLGSTNGTWLNGAQIDVPVVLGQDDTVRLGGTELRLVQDARVGARSSGETTAAVTTGDASGPDVVRARGGDADEARRTSIDRVAIAASEEKPDVASLRGDGDTVTIVFSDIESSTEQAMALGDAKWFEALSAHNEIVRTALKKYGGTEIKSQGDGFMLSFPSARRALQCCVEIQRDLTAYAEEHPDQGVRIRIGLHTGEAIADDAGDLFGKHIILAARIANLADGGQILASGVVKEITSSRGDLVFGHSDEVELKGIAGAYHVHDVDWRESLGALA